jgi:polysaccharide biosynthesis protein PelA
MLLISVYLPILTSFMLTPFCSFDQKAPDVLICYGKLKPEEISGYHTLILESKHFFASHIRVFKKQNKEVYAYISLGEVNVNAPHYAKLSASTTGKNEQWDSHYLDLESATTKKVLLEIIDSIFAMGYDGLFLDNIDNFNSYGPQKEQKQALVELIKKIKTSYPTKKLIQNAGLALVPETYKYISSIAIESVATAYDFKSQQYQLSSDEQWNTLSTAVTAIQSKYEKPIILIEYADKSSLLAQIQERSQTLDCSLFVGAIDLQKKPNFN